MNTLTLTLCASTRTGCLSGPIPSCADERLTLAGDLTLSAGTSIALLTPRGDTLAHTILSEECAPCATIPLSTLTAQAAEYTRSCRAGDTREALLAIGDSEHPLALIPARIAQNPLYTIAPPTDLAPAYPTTETLKSLLAEMQAASNAAAQSATAARKSAEVAGESASSAASDRATAVYSATSAQAYAEVATAAQARSSTSAAEAATSATNAASSEDSARDSASSAISAANSAAGSASKAAASADSAAFALTASTNAANRAEVAAEKAREADISAASSAAAASQSATSAAQEAAENVTALIQGKVDAAEAAKSGAEAAKTAAETAKTGADAASAAAASSATAAANSATAAAKSATDLADAVATAESLDGRLSAIEPSALRAKDVVISNVNNTYADGAFSYNPAIETFYNHGTIGTGANFLAYCSGLKWVYASHWDQIGSNAFRECTSLTEVKGSVWRVCNVNNDSSEIGARAFFNCTNLEKMPPVSNDIKTLESGYWASVRIINTGAFYNCRKLPAQFVKDIISSPALWSIKDNVLSYCCLDSGGIDELVLGKNIVFNSFGAFAKSGVRRVDCSQMVKDPIFNGQFTNSQLEEIVLPQRQFSYYNAFSGVKYLRYVKMPPEQPINPIGNSLFVKGNSYSSVDEVTVEFPITRAEAEAWTKYQRIVLDSFPLEKTIFNFTDEQGVTYNA